MKSRIACMSLLLAMGVFAVNAQESDDMYFRASDRTKVAASKPLMELSSRQSEQRTPINPTDSYSARNVNPEYISQSANSTVESEQVTYFTSDYVPTSVNQNIYNDRANWNYYGMNNPYMMGGMYPYGVGRYNPYWGNSIWDPYGYNSYYGSGLTFSMGMSWGLNSWGYSPWNSYYGMNSWAWDPYGYNSFWGWNSGWGWNNYWRPTVIIVGNDGPTGVVYGKRSSRSSSMNNQIVSSTGSRQSSSAIQNDTRGTNHSRTAARTTNENYYQRGWRNNPENVSTTRGTVWNNTNTSGSRTSSSTFDNNRSSNRSGNWMDAGGGGNSSRNSSFNSGSRDSGSGISTGGGGGNSSRNSSFNSGSRDSGSGISTGGGSGSRSSGSSGGSSSSGSRGRNN